MNHACDLAHNAISQNQHHGWSAALDGSPHLPPETAQVLQHCNEPNNTLTLGWYTASATQNGCHTDGMW